MAGGASFGWALFLGGLALSALLTVVSLAFWPHFVGFFLLLPFVFALPWKRGRNEPARPERRCPECGWSTGDAQLRYCPRHGRAIA